MAGRFSVEAIFKAVDRVSMPVSRIQRNVLKFSKGTETAMRRTERALSKVSGSILRVGKSAAKLAAVSFAGVTAGVGLLVREFSKVENAQAAFTPLLGSAAKAQEAVQALNDTAASTPFQFETLAASFQQLLPVSDGNIQNLIKTVRMLGDTAGGNAQKLESITRGYTKAFLKGRTDLESLNMIAEAGVPIFKDLAAVLNVPVGEALFDQISAGQVATESLNEAFQRLTSEGGSYFRGMEIASRTTTGMWSTLKDNVSLTAAEIGGILAPTVKDFIASSTEAARSVKKWVIANRELISKRFTDFISNVRVEVDRLMAKIIDLNAQYSLFDRFIDVLESLGSAFSFLKQHGATIAKLIGSVLALTLAFKGLTAVMTIVNIVMTANPIGLIVVAIGALVAAIAGVIIWWDELKNAFKPVADYLTKRLDTIKEKLKSVMSLPTKITSLFNKGLEIIGLKDVALNTPPQNIVTPQERTARMIEEKRTTSRAEVVIKDETKRAQVEKGKLSTGIKLIHSGAF